GHSGSQNGHEPRVSVLFISSGAARRPIGGWSIYGATKRGGESFFEALAAQHEGDPRVRVGNVNPGVIDTRMQAQLPDYACRDGYFPERERFVAVHQQGELRQPADVAREIIAAHVNTRG